MLVPRCRGKSCTLAFRLISILGMSDDPKTETTANCLHYFFAPQPSTERAN